MKAIFFIIFLFITPILISAKETTVSEKFVLEGIPYMKKGDYEGALKRFNKSIDADTNFLTAKIYKAQTLYYLDSLDTAIEECKKFLIKNQDTSLSLKIYKIYGLSLKKKSNFKEAIDILLKGVQKFPKEVEFNLAIGECYYELNNSNLALMYFQNEIINYPQSDLAYLASFDILKSQKRTIPAVMSLIMNIINSEVNKSSNKKLTTLLDLIKQKNIKAEGNNITINKVITNIADTNDLSDGFLLTEGMLAMSIKNDKNNEYYKINEVGSFKNYLNTISSTLKQNLVQSQSFYWQYMAQYFVQLLELNYIDTVSHIIFTSSDDELNKDWLEQHKEDVINFYKWNDNFKWK